MYVIARLRACDTACVRVCLCHCVCVCARAAMNHPIIVDLVGKTVDNFLVKPNTHTLLLLYWTNCQHCEDLMPAYESVALKLKEAHK